MRVSALVAGLVWMAASPAMSAGAVVVSLNNPGSTTMHEVEVKPGDEFNVDINIEPTTAMVWLRFTLTASSSSLLTLSDGTFYGPFDMARSPIPVGPLTPHSDELGAAVSTFEAQQVSSPLGSLSFVVDAQTQPGEYTVNLASVYWKDSWVSTVLPFPAQVGPGFNIHVVPEPSLTAVLILSGLLVFRRGH